MDYNDYFRGIDAVIIKNKRQTILICILAVIVFILTLFAALNILNAPDSRIQKLYSYGEYIEKMDVPPNTVVARFNGEEILFCEVESTRKSINYSINNGSSESIGESAFYTVLTYKLYAQTAIEQKNASNYNLNAEENIAKPKREWESYSAEKQNEWLESLCIERDEIWLSEENFIKYLQKKSIDRMLVSKGMGIVFDTVFENPELSGDSRLASKYNMYKRMQHNSDLSFIFLFSEVMKVSDKLEKTYVEKLILDADLELCADDKELSYTLPVIEY